MESTARLEMRIGLLVLAGVTALVVLILASDRIRFDSSYRVTVYLDDAVGLNVGSPVKLAGITIGRIELIRPSNDPRGQVEAQIGIRRAYTIDRSAELINQPAGIFGDNVLAFTSPPADRPADPLPKDGSAEVRAGSTFLDEAQGQAERILDGLARLLAEDSVDDLRAAFGNARTLTDEGAAFLQAMRQHDARIERTLTAVERLATGLEETRVRVDRRLLALLEDLEATLQSVRVSSELLASDVHAVADDAERLMQGGTGLVDQVATVLADERAGLDATLADLRTAAASLRDLLAGVEDGRGVIGQLLTSDALARDVNDAVITAGNVVERVADNPDVLVWGTTPEEREEARRERERRMIRRAFMEGYRYRQPRDAGGADAPAGERAEAAAPAER